PLVAGPTALTPPPGVRVVSVGTAREMAAAVEEAFAGATVVIMTAAVADYRPRERYPRKLKKDAAGLALELDRNPDILAGLGARKAGRRLSARSLRRSRSARARASRPVGSACWQALLRPRPSRSWMAPMQSMLKRSTSLRGSG